MQYSFNRSSRKGSPGSHSDPLSATVGADALDLAAKSRIKIIRRLQTGGRLESLTPL